MSSPRDLADDLPTTLGLAHTLADAEPSPAAPSAAPSTLANGGGPVVLADRYELLALLGEGGMGTVYLARDRELDERVALKVLRRELWGTPGTLDRFRREVRLARRVTHRNVARVFDIGEHDRDRFLTMEYVDGGSLARLVAREGRLLLSRAVEVARDVAGGLAAAHAAGVLHRDLKPDNVLIESSSGRAMITDFGVARLLDEAAGAQTIGHMVGTPAYMAPEQVEGRPDVDARVDLYALGALLYEALAGERPWSGATLYAMAAARLQQPPPDPRARRPEVPEPLAALVLRLMARHPDDRPASAVEVVDLLESLRLPEDATISRPALEPALALSSGPGEKTLAVLPCRAIDLGDDYLADGFTEDLIDSLSMVEGLRVRSLGAVLPYKGRTEDPRQVGRELWVQVVAGSSLRRDGDKLLLTARLIGVTDGFQLWAQRFECSVADLFRTGDLVAAAVARALRVSWTSAERRPPSDPEVLELYLRGRQEYHKFWPEHVEVAVGLLERANALAPNDPNVMSAYALALSRLYALDHASDPMEQRARATAEAAARLAPHLAEPRVALATLALNAGHAEAAAHELAEALRISPQSSDAQEMLGRVLIEVGRPEEGLRRLRQVVAAGPTSAALRFDMAKTQALLGEWAEAEALLEERPAEPAVQARFWTTRGRLLMWRPEPEQVVTFAREVEAARFEFQPTVVALAHLVATGANAAAARPVIDLVRARAARATTAKRARAFFCQIAAEVAAFSGDGESVEWALGEGDRLGLIDLVWLDRCPLLDAFRQQPAVAAVRERVAARAAGVLAALGG